jgi:TetR/AcrR family transcriptional regulator, repressor of fatR-cypB operon
LILLQKAKMEQEIENNNNKKLDTPDEILLAALRLFAQKGFFNTSLTDIAKEAGIKTTSGVYQHFKNKQTIAAALYANIIDSLSISIDDIRRCNKKPSEQLREVVGLLFRLAQDAPDIIEFLFVIKLSEFLPDEKPLIETAPFIKIIKIIQAGIKAEEIKNVDPMLVYTLFFGIINHTLVMAVSGNLNKSVDSYQSPAWLAAWHAIHKK